MIDIFQALGAAVVGLIFGVIVSAAIKRFSKSETMPPWPVYLSVAIAFASSTASQITQNILHDTVRNTDSPPLRQSPKQSEFMSRDGFIGRYGFDPEIELRSKDQNNAQQAANRASCSSFDFTSTLIAKSYYCISGPMGQLDVLLTNSNVYRYYGVPISINAKFEQAASAGRFFNAQIKEKYACSRLNKLGGNVVDGCHLR